MNNKILKKVEKFYNRCGFRTKIYVKIRLLLTPFEKVDEAVPKEGVIYDLGCGYGIFSNLMALRYPKRKVIGIDLSKDRIEAAKKSIGQRKNIQFICNNLKNVNLKECGTIVIYDVLHHMNYDAQEKLIGECYEKLKEDGLLIIKDNGTTPGWKFLWNYLHEIITMLLLITKSDKLSFRTKNSFINLLFKKGFIVEAINIPTSLPYPFVLYFCRKASSQKADAGLVLINPPLTSEERYGAMAKGGRNAPPMGLCILAAMARKNGYKVTIIDAPVMGFGHQEVVREITELSPKFVGITASTLAINSAGKLAMMIKKARKETVVLIGGPHLTAVPRKTLLEYSGFDFGVVGEGEETLIGLLNALRKKKDLNRIPGLAFRKNGKVVLTSPREYIKDLDRLPLPAWDLLPPLNKFYRSSPQSFNRLPSSSLVTSRGCPNQCTFCDRSIFGNIVRGYSPEYVLKMLKILSIQYGIKHLLIDDDTFTILRERLEKICHLIIKEKLDLTWTCLARVDTVDEKILRLMKKAGCWQILYGIESGNQEILNKLQKRITIEQVREAVKITHKVGIKTKGFFILGSPYETKATAEETIRFMKRILLDDFHMTFFTPFPGTKIFNNEIKNKMIYERKWAKMNEWLPVFIPRGFSQDELISFSKKAFREFYFRPKIVWTYLLMTLKTGNFTSIFFGINALSKYLFFSDQKE